MTSWIAYADRWVALAAVLAALAAAALAWRRHDTAWDRDARLGLWVLAAITVLAILLPVFGYWAGGRTNANAIGGLIPWNDAAGYFNCARALADGGALDSFCQRRPHYSGYLTSLFALSGERLQLTLLLQAGLIALACFLYIRVIVKRWGLTAAFLALAPVAAFAGEYSITTLTENLGLPLGLVAVAILLTGIQPRRTGALAFGAFLLAVAINARAGAFFVLPLLVLWPLLLRDMALGARLRLSALLFVAVAAGFVVGPVLTTLLGGNAASTHANFSYTIYGIAAGGKGWLHIYEVHPDLVSKVLPKSERAANVYAATWQLFLQQPDLTLQGLVKGFLTYLERILKYIPLLPVRIVVVLAWLAGIVAIVRRRRTPEGALLGLLALGIAASAPILAFDAGLRIYAATIAVDAAIAALGMAAFLGWLFRKRAPQQQTDQQWPSPGRVLSAYAALLLFMVIVLPVALYASAHPERFPALQSACAADEFAVPARLGRSSVVLPVVGPDASSTWPVRPPADRFTARIDRYTYGALGFKETVSGTTYISAYDLSEDRNMETSIWAAEGLSVPLDGHVYLVCIDSQLGEFPLDGVKRVVSFTYIED